MTHPVEVVLRIRGDKFTAGLVAIDGVVKLAAPKIAFMKGWDGVKVRDYCREKGWSYSVVPVKKMYKDN